MEHCLAKEKQRLRKQARQITAGLDAAVIAQSDAAITRRVLALCAYAAARTVFTYASVGREADTRALINAALAAGKRVCVPRCLSGGVMAAAQIAALDALRPAKMGLWEPDQTAPLVPPKAIDLVLAPCLAADGSGTRLGQGGGYYDRFLPEVSCSVACLCRRALLWEVLPREAWDVPADLVITEDAVILPVGMRKRR